MMVSLEYSGIALLALLGPVSSFVVAPQHHGVVLQIGAPSSSSIRMADVYGRTRSPSFSSSPSQLYSTTSDSSSQVLSDERRKILLTRKGPHFLIDRSKNIIEFGATANLVTDLGEGGEAVVADDDTISDWLRDEQGLALSIWDPKLTTELGNNVYRLQTMNLQFVTIQLAPTVDLEMKTIIPSGDGPPTFMLKSVGFDPNIQILPGMRFDASSLGIVIETAGILRQGSRGGSVAGLIAFQTTGQLPAFLRIVPEAILRAASDTINQTVVKFAVDSFQTGAKRNFQQFVQKRRSSQ
jgi:Protein of unknown function (DUF1997)